MPTTVIELPGHPSYLLFPTTKLSGGILPTSKTETMVYSLDFGRATMPGGRKEGHAGWVQAGQVPCPRQHCAYLSGRDPQGMCRCLLLHAFLCSLLLPRTWVGSPWTLPLGGLPACKVLLPSGRTSTTTPTNMCVATAIPRHYRQGMEETDDFLTTSTLPMEQQWGRT